MQNNPPQFVAESVGGCAVSKDGNEVTIELEGGRITSLGYASL
jgi:hypothetical protein